MRLTQWRICYVDLIRADPTVVRGGRYLSPQVLAALLYGPGYIVESICPSELDLVECA